MEDRRVLDVTAAFSSATGQLQLLLSNPDETAIVAINSGSISITNSQQQAVAIDVDGNGPAVVNASVVDSIQAQGDAAPNQSVVLASPLALPKGLTIESSIDRWEVRAPITRVEQGAIRVAAAQIHLAADLETVGQDIELQGQVELGGEVRLTGRDITFGATIDDDGSAVTPSRLVILGAGTTRFQGTVGGTRALDHLETDAAGRTELGADIHASGDSIQLLDPVLLTGNVRLEDSGTTGILLGGTVDSAPGSHFSLTLAATAGEIRFQGDLGAGTNGDQQLGALRIEQAQEGVWFGDAGQVHEIRVAGPVDLGGGAEVIGGAGIVFDGGGMGTDLSATGGTRFNGPVTLAGDLRVATAGGLIEFTSDATIDSQVNLAHSLTLDAGVGAIAFHADLGSVVPLSGLTIQRADGGVAFGGADTKTRGGAGPLSRIRSVEAVVVGSNRSISGGIRFNAGPGQTLEITTTNDDVRLNGPVTLESHLSVDTGNDAGDILFLNGTVNGQAGESNRLTLSAGAGKIQFTRDLGNLQPLGSLIVSRADGGLAFGTAETAADGAGPVTAIRVQDRVDLGATNAILGGGGIVFQGGAAGSVELTTQTGDIRVHGAVVLESDLHVVGGANLLFTNEAPIDSAPGETHNLRLDAGAGRIAFQEDLGSIRALGSLWIERARDGVFFGESTTEVPGAGHLGPVERVVLEGTLELGTGTNLIGGAGIVLTGGATSPLRISTTGDTLRFHGAVTLGTDVVLTTGTGADVTFTQAASLDSAAGRVSSLEIDAGTGAVRFNEDLGAGRKLGALTVTRADAGVFFGGADAETTDAAALGPVQQIRLDQFANLGVGTQTIAGGIHFNGGPTEIVLSTTDDMVRLNGPVRLQSDLRIDTGTGPGDVIFTSAATVDSQDGPASGTQMERNDLRILAGLGKVEIGANLGALQALDALRIEGAKGGISLGTSASPLAGGGGPVTLVHTDGLIDLGVGETSAEIAGPIVFNGGTGRLTVETSNDLVRINGPVTLDSDVTFRTHGGNLVWTAAATGNAPVGEAPRLEVDVGAGDANFGASLGAAGRLGTIVLATVDDVFFAGSVIATRIEQTTGTGRTTFAAAVNTNDAGFAGLDLHGDAFRFDGPVAASGDGRIVIEHQGLLDWNPGADVRADGAFREFGGGRVELGGTLATSGDIVRFEGDVMLTDGGAINSLISTIAGGQATGADIDFQASVSAAAAGTQGLILNAGTLGDIRFVSAVGSTTPLGAITVVQAADVLFLSTVAASRFHQLDGQGLTSFAGSALFSHTSLPGIDITTRDLRFGNSVTTTGNGEVIVQPRGGLEIQAANWNLQGPLRQLGTATTRLAANLATSGDLVSFAGPVVLTANVRVDTGAGPGDVRFHSSVNQTGGNWNVTVASGTGDILFASSIGDQGSLGAVRIESARDLTLSGNLIVDSLTQLAGSGVTSIQASVSTQGAGGVELAANQIEVRGAIDVGNGGPTSPIRLSALTDLLLQGNLTTRDGALVLNAGGQLVLGNAARVQSVGGMITLTADHDGSNGGGVAMADGSVVQSTAGVIAVTATDNVTLAQLVTGAEILVTSTSAAILDAGDANGPNLLAPAARLIAARGIGLDATGTGKDARQAEFLETRLSTLAASNSTAGGIHIRNEGTGTLSVGTVAGLAGISNHGSGPIELLHSGRLAVDQLVRTTGGGNIDLRAGVGADLVVNRPVQSVAGDGSIFLFAGRDLILHDSLPEPPGRSENPTNPGDFFEVLVVGAGAIRGEAGRDVLLDDGDTDYVIVHTATGQITNVAPLLTIRPLDQGGSDIDESGRGYIEVTIGDDVHLETNYHIQVDWGDGEVESYPIPGTIRADRAPGNTDARFVSGVADGLGVLQPGVYVFTHKYFAHPNQQDPAAPIPIRVELRYDARPAGSAVIDGNRPADGSAVFNGIRFVNRVGNEVFTFQEDEFTVPGTGNFTFVKVVESVIVPVEIRTSTAPPVVQATVTFNASSGIRNEFRTTTFESQTQAEYRLFLRVVDDVTGNEGKEDIDLSLNWLDDPLSLFRSRRFPNGHYRVYLEEVRTRRVRLILDVHIFDGRVVPPNYRDGAGERQPGADSQQPADNSAKPPAADAPATNDNAQTSPAATPEVASPEVESSEVESSKVDFQAGPPRSVHRLARLLRQLRPTDTTP